MNLVTLLNKINAIEVTGSPEEKEIESIEIDSRKVKPGALFIAIKGFQTDGHYFIPQAISNGAAAVMLQNSEAVPDELFTVNNVVKIVVKDTRKLLPFISDYFYGSPSKKLTLIGITGTKGKTTTTYFLREIFLEAGISSGLIGTNKNIIGKKEIPSHLTTPEANEINELLALMVEQDCKAAVMEASSHSIDLGRVEYLDFDIGIFTNITSDHMDYHKTFENYLEVKSRFFKQLKRDGKIIYNSDDENWEKILKGAKAGAFSYGAGDEAYFRMKDIEFSLHGTSWKLYFENEEIALRTKLIGHFNAYNATAAFAAAYLLGLKAETISRAIAKAPQVPGRFEVVGGGKKKVIVDYSHTADSLKQALLAVRHIVGNNFPVYTVFGCGGDRDKTKRPLMGSIAETFSDRVIITSDNPRSEDPLGIIADIKAGLKKKNHEIIEDRELAIKKAIEESPEDAVILIAGKGHENYQEIKGKRRHFSDKETALKYLGEV